MYYILLVLVLGSIASNTMEFLAYNITRYHCIVYFTTKVRDICTIASSIYSIVLKYCLYTISSTDDLN